MGQLKLKMLGEMQLKNYSEKTIKSYLSNMQHVANYYKKSPALLSTDDIKKYLLYMINEKKLSASSVRIAYYSLKFFYNNVIGNKNIMDTIPCQKLPIYKPAVLSQKEITRILNLTENIKHKAIFMTIYSAGLRVSELVNLKVSDIDSDRMQIFIRQSKGKKDRYVPLARKTLEYLRVYWKKYRATDWLFYSTGGMQTKYSIRTVQKIFQDKSDKAGIKKKVSIHTLRHSYATHMIEQGVGLHHLQLLMGHSNPKTTSNYLHVQKKDLLKIMSPLDKMIINEPLPQASGINRSRRHISSSRKGLHQTESA